MDDLLYLSSQAKSNTIELLDFLQPADQMKQLDSARFWALSRVVLATDRNGELEQQNDSSLCASSSHFLQRWTSVLYAKIRLSLQTTNMIDYLRMSYN